MTLNRTRAALLLATLAGAAAVHSIAAQSPSSASAPQVPQPALRPQSSPASRPVIVLDPAHGGADTGASLPGNLAEKDVTLAFAQKLRALLGPAGFTVITTRDSDPAVPLSTDDRAQTANRAHALACIVLHATAAGSGVHVYTSTLQPAPALDADSVPAYAPVPWESAQAAFVTQSRRLGDDLRETLTKSGASPLLGRAPLRPLDNLLCPAVALEIAPQSSGDGSSTPVTDSGYQQTVAQAIVAALQAWSVQNPSGDAAQ
ncbi:MAG TPA: N-acetylmuramoyl-L-alanine amidase [Acidobacteriaceae bacterium]|nr:N-acetylmuramoyl-L-alanine amidase [Acidobacteriaceae bacterium]